MDYWQSINWEALAKNPLTSVAIQVVLVIGVFWTLRVYYRILRATKEASKAENTIAIVQMIQADDVRGARDHLYSALKNLPYQHWKKEDKDQASHVCAAFDLAAIMASAGVIDKDMVLVHWGPNITQCHAICEPFIRDRQGENPRFYRQFEELSEQVAAKDRWSEEAAYLKARDTPAKS